MKKLLDLSKEHAQNSLRLEGEELGHGGRKTQSGYKAKEAEKEAVEEACPSELLGHGRVDREGRLSPTFVVSFSRWKRLLQSLLNRLGSETTKTRANLHCYIYCMYIQHKYSDTVLKHVCCLRNHVYSCIKLHLTLPYIQFKSSGDAGHALLDSVHIFFFKLGGWV